MKKIKILHKTLLVFNTVILLGLLVNICLYYGIIPESSETFINGEKPNQIQFILINLFTLLFLVGLFFIQKALSHMYSSDYFNLKSSKLLKTGGLVLIIYSFISKTTYFFPFNESTINFEMKFESALIEVLFTIVIISTGVACLIFAEMLSKGNELKTDNDLTI
ncbi:MAG: DUF2975 domain-containing protein [Flavobacteriales bacterium]|nr:DUF2975 domain-containing protein [Flavobacteriales bacterium]